MKTVVLRRCWSVYLDTNGNAPADATVVSCATEELANQVCSLYAARKDKGLDSFIVLNGQKHYDLQYYFVDGYNFDTFYTVVEDWQPDSRIIRSLSALIDIADQQEDTDMPNGVFSVVL